ncbi:hypothetical protein IGI39_003364 [Enterococcus sp. AZ135]|uniref:hypothetical protein n=1 Tax=unclassified Enterococcus TaxID=2608891 RepID=UPI003F28F7C0
MNENGFEVNAESVIDQLLKRLSQVELENASLKVALEQVQNNKQKVTKEGE